MLVSEPTAPTSTPPNRQRFPWSVSITMTIVMTILCSLALASPGRARPIEEPIFLDAGALEFFSCWRLKEDEGGQSCYHGSGWYTGCSGDCMYSTLDFYDLLRFECSYRFTGRVIDVRDGGVARDLPIHVLLPDQSRASTRTDEDGFFRIEIEMPNFSCLVEQGFDELRTWPDEDGITLYSTFSERFREQNLELEILSVPTQRFREQR